MPRTKVGSLSWVLLQEALASGPDGATGVKSRPLWEALGSMGVFGIIFASSVQAYADARSYFAAFFVFVSAMLAFTILPDTLEVRDRRLEIIGPRPISSRVFFAAETVTLLLIVALIDTAIALPALIGARLAFELSWLSILGLLAALFACTASIVVVWLCALLLVARWLPLRRIRLVLQTALLVTMLGAAWASVWLVAREGAERILLDAPWVIFVPTTWFVDAVFTGSPAELVGLSGVIATSGYIYCRLDPDSLYRRLAEATPGRRKQGVGLRILRWAAPARRYAVAVAGLILTVSAREELAWLRTTMFRLIVTVVFVVALSSGEHLTWTFFLAHVAFIALLDGVFLFRESSEPEAAWIFQVTPVSRRDVAAGIGWAVRLRYALLPAVFMAIHLFRVRPAANAAGLLLAFFLVCGFLEALGLWRFPVPLGKKSSSLSGVFPSLVISTLGLFAFAFLFALFEVAIAAGLVGSSFMAGLVFILRRRCLAPSPTA